MQLLIKIAFKNNNFRIQFGLIERYSIVMFNCGMLKIKI